MNYLTDSPNRRRSSRTSSWNRMQHVEAERAAWARAAADAEAWRAVSSIPAARTLDGVLASLDRAERAAHWR